MPGTTRGQPTGIPLRPPEADSETTGEAAQSIATRHHHLGPHFTWTALRPATPEDLARVQELVRILRLALQPYRDYRVAIEDGYEPFLPKVEQRHYHYHEEMVQV